MVTDNHSKQRFTNKLLADIQALERLLEEGKFEDDISRIGAEQEFCIIDYSLRPAMMAMEMLDHLNDDHFTTELAKFNLELNLDPVEFSDTCFTRLENNLINLLTKANKTAHALGGKIILTGILPTIYKKDISLENMTPKERYYKLNEAILAARASDFKFHITGVDELIAKHDNVLFESCNTSFQIHLQVEPDHAASLYNWAHAISGPVLAACTNSPLFLGKRLWDETRIALFQQAADTRKSVSPYRKEQERVTFGKNWEKDSVLHIFQDAVGKFEILLPLPVEEDSLQSLEEGRIPSLKALTLHNSTIYRWNRMCYGVTGNRPHFRIENRYIPSGPTIIDEVANAAFWTGLMNGMPEPYKKIHEMMEFDHARNNFFTAARSGLQAQFRWFDDRLVTAQDLILEELLPMAREGLTAAGTADQDIGKYLDIIEERVSLAKTGSRWILTSYNQLLKNVSEEEAAVTVTEGIYRRQKKGNPVHTWSDLKREEGGGWRNKYRYVKQLMSKDLITLHEDDILELAKNIMLWSHIHHIPVENDDGELVGLLTADHILGLPEGNTDPDEDPVTVGAVMARNVPTVTPNTRTRHAFFEMKKNEVDCLPVLTDSKLVGIVTMRDYVNLMTFFFREVSVKNDEAEPGT